MRRRVRPVGRGVVRLHNFAVPSAPTSRIREPLRGPRYGHAGQTAAANHISCPSAAAVAALPLRVEASRHGHGINLARRQRCRCSGDTPADVVLYRTTQTNWIVNV